MLHYMQLYGVLIFACAFLVHYRRGGGEGGDLGRYFKECE